MSERTAQRKDFADAHAEGLHEDVPREGCPECEDQGRVPAGTSLFARVDALAESDLSLRPRPGETAEDVVARVTAAAKKKEGFRE